MSNIEENKGCVFKRMACLPIIIVFFGIGMSALCCSLFPASKALSDNKPVLPTPPTPQPGDINSVDIVFVPTPIPECK